MAGAIALVPSVECSTCKSAPSVRSYDCHLSEKYACSSADSFTICEKYTCAVWMRVNIYTIRH